MNQSPAKILITGPPGCGKTTLVQQVVEKWQGHAGGFITQEIRGPHGRTGFRIVTLDGKEGILATKQGKGGKAQGARRAETTEPAPRVGSYVVNVSVMEELAIPSIKAAIELGGLVVIDEIGKMEFHHPGFAPAGEGALRSDGPVLATIMLRPHPIADRFRGLPQVEVVRFAGSDNESRRRALEAVQNLLWQ